MLKFRIEPVEKLPDLDRVGHIRVDGNSAAAERRDRQCRLPGAFLVPVNEHQVSSGLGQCDGHGPAQTLSRAGNNRDSPRKVKQGVHHHE
jgi:hypothetical protein